MDGWAIIILKNMDARPKDLLSMTTDEYFFINLRAKKKFKIFLNNKIQECVDDETAAITNKVIIIIRF